MDYQAIMTLIGSLGFPICACVGLGYFIVKQLSDMTKTHKEEIDQLRTCLENNTLAIQRLIDRLSKDEEK